MFLIIHSAHIYVPVEQVHMVNVLILEKADFDTFHFKNQ